MATPTYWDVLAAVKSLAQGLSGFDGLEVSINKWPGFNPLVGAVRQLIVAPNDRLAERIPEMQFDSNCWKDYEVYLILVSESRYDEETIRWRMERRKELWDALFKPTALVSEVAADFDVNYDPEPGGIDAASIPKTLDWTAQKFTYRTSEARPA